VSKSTTLSRGPNGAGDQLSIELIEPIGMPPAVRINWPMRRPSSALTRTQTVRPGSCAWLRGLASNSPDSEQPSGSRWSNVPRKAPDHLGPYTTQHLVVSGRSPLVLQPTVQIAAVREPNNAELHWFAIIADDLVAEPALLISV
jgi:hypothetical protein